MTLEIIIGIVVFISIILSIFVIFNNKFQLAIIKIDKAEEDITLYLQKKEELLNRTKPIICKELKIENIMEELDCIPVDATNIEVHAILKRSYNEFFRIIDENEKLLKSKPLGKIMEELDENEENVIGSIKFYNDTLVDYNKLVISFPSSVVAFIRRYKRKDFYSNEKREV